MQQNSTSNNNVIISTRTVKRIRCSVVAGHFLVILLVLTASVIADWLNFEEPTITIQFYDPALDNIVENPSPDPDPDNPIPPTGTQDGGAEESEPEPEPEPAPDPEPAPPVEQPEVAPKPVPKPVVNKSLPKPLAAPTVKAIKQPKASKRKLPKKPQPAKTTGKKSDLPKKISAASKSGSKGPRGSKSEAGHTRPGGQKGNSGYDVQVAMMIKRMWVTPDINRLGGRTPRVLIELNIAPDGRVTSKRIRTRSGVLAMDESIQSLLDNLHYVKAPFDGEAHTLVFWMKADDV